MKLFEVLGIIWNSKIFLDVHGWLQYIFACIFFWGGRNQELDTINFGAVDEDIFFYLLHSEISFSTSKTLVVFFSKILIFWVFRGFDLKIWQHWLLGCF